jgi:hypothetical protein
MSWIDTIKVIDAALVGDLMIMAVKKRLGTKYKPLNAI